MTPQSVLITAMLLGAFVSFGGIYGACYALGSLHGQGRYRVIAICAYVAQCAVTLAIAFETPLDLGWKLLIVVSVLAYAFVPTVTLRYLRDLHSP